MKQINKFIKKNKLKMIVISIIFICCISILVFVKNNHFLYEETIIKVIEVKEIVIETENQTEPRYIQHIKARVMNGNNKGHIIEFENERSYSGLTDYNLNKGDEIFVEKIENLSYLNIENFKRDYYIILIIVIFCFILILVATKKSILIIITMIINIFIFTLIIYLRSQGINVFILFCLGAVLFTIITLLIICGFNKKALCAIISTLISITVMMLIAYSVINLYYLEIYFETIEFSEYFQDYDMVFYSGVLISGLGSIMDITILMATSINELVTRDSKISNEALKKSAWEIAQDTTGTTMNVLFFASIIGTIPIVIFLARNGQPILWNFRYWGSAEIIRALVGSIGIVLAIPISYIVNLSIRKRWKI